MDKKTQNIYEIKVRPEKIHDQDHIGKLVSKTAGVDDKTPFKVLKRSIDARGKNSIYLLRVLVGEDDVLKNNSLKNQLKPLPASAKKVLIIGAGPAGYFAAFELIEYGLKPIILERGKDVDSRRKDIARLYRQSVVNPDSNYCYGEGGAGTFSDGKLYTRATKRGDVNKVLKLFVDHGANPDILVDAHPHIGSNKLPGIISRMRKTILEYGGDIFFNAKVVDLVIKDQKCLGVITENGREWFADAIILATGHSAGDIFEMLYRKNLFLEPKPFAMGVRVEHPQELIDQIQYHSKKRPQNLPPASYRLTGQVDGRGVFSFCMCPGGYVIPASTLSGELVLNGMSMSSRSAPMANAGVVVETRPEDIGCKDTKDPLCMLRFQSALEKKVFEASGSQSQVAPAQRLTDFFAGRLSETIPKSSYIPGTMSCPVHEILPGFISNRLKKAFRIFDNKMKGYFTREATVLAVESRTSSPVKIPRDPKTLMHPQVENLYPCGEGAGHAGGIVSAAMDGRRVAKVISELLQ
ncbi:MAG: FAD-binding protein [Desulfobacterales bacterium]|nr:FAD-binding protein [Desulfobacterales bacterium]